MRQRGPLHARCVAERHARGQGARMTFALVVLAGLMLSALVWLFDSFLKMRQRVYNLEHALGGSRRDWIAESLNEADQRDARKSDS